MISCQADELKIDLSLVGTLMLHRSPRAILISDAPPPPSDSSPSPLDSSPSPAILISNAPFYANHHRSEPKLPDRDLPRPN
ncbi:hypothetical protein E3N88_00604 [Mikania micrantha]|uniref:Uncharacterized protein n=1 Tax=Mikania micrantha TaxID=192012 RepID=A0A5N6Q0V9_9ASTR|nr:hypothetical protein E3N88_00604 [Mikania micrantha]